MSAISAPAAGPGTDFCVLYARSQVHYYLVLQAAYEHSAQWVTHGIQPPSAEPIEILSMASSPLVAARDNYAS